MKVSFEGILWDIKEVVGEDDSLIIDVGHINTGRTENLSNIISKLHHIENKYVRVTIEEIKETGKNDMPVCYAAVGVA